MKRREAQLAIAEICEQVHADDAVAVLMQAMVAIGSNPAERHQHALQAVYDLIRTDVQSLVDPVGERRRLLGLLGEVVWLASRNVP